MFTRCKILSVFLAIYIFLVGFAAADGTKVYKIGVLAKRGQERCLAKWTATADYLTDTVDDASFEIVPLDFEQIYPAVENEQVDFIITTPSSYVGLELLHDISKIATLKNLIGENKSASVFGGVIFCRADRQDIHEITDLKNKIFMGVSKTSFGGWQAACRELKDRGIDPYRDFSSLRFGGTHDAVVYAVRDGRVDAGTVRTDTLERMSNEALIDFNEFKVIYGHNKHRFYSSSSKERIALYAEVFPLAHSTHLYPEWPFAKLSGTDNEMAGKVSTSLLLMPAESAAAKAALCKGWTVAHNYLSIHECLKGLHAGPYKDYGKPTISEIIEQYHHWVLGAICILGASMVFMVYILRLNRKLTTTLAELKNVGEQHDAIIAASMDGFIVIDDDGNFIDVNNAYCHQIGYSRQELLTMGLRDVEIAETPTEIKEHLEKVAREKRDFFETRQRRKDGDIIDLEISTHYIPLHGGIRFAFHRDITQRKKTEKQLVESENKYRLLSDEMELILDHVPALVFYKDTKNNYIRVNKYIADAHKMQKEQLEGKNLFDLYPKDQAQAYWDDDLEVINSGTPKLMYEEVWNTDQGARWICTSKIPYIEETGKVAGIIGFSFDITERKHADEELQKFRNISDKAMHGNAIVDMQGNITYINDCFAQIHGYDPNELIGRNLSIFHTAKQMEVVNQINGSWVEKGGYSPVEVWHIHKDGTEFPMLMSSVVIYDESGESKYIAASAIDITERKQAEEKIKQQQYYLEKAQELGQIGTWELDIKQNKLYWTDKNYQIFGVPTGSVMNYEVFIEKIHPDDREYVDREWKAAVEGKPYDIEHRLLIDGTIKWVREKAELKFDEGGTAIIAIGFTQDITDLKQAKEILQKAHDELEQRVEKRTKELVQANNQLQVDLIKRKRMGKNLRSLASKLSLIEENERHRIANMLHDEVTQNLVLFKIKLGLFRKHELRKEVSEPFTEIYELLDDIIQDIRTLTFDLSCPILYELGLEAAIRQLLEIKISQEYGIATEFQTDGQQIHIDKDLRIVLYRAVKELLFNVIKHAKAKNVKFSMWKDKNKLWLSVEDDGIGFKKEILDRTYSKTGGLGLFNIDERLRLLGGSVEIESKHNRGTKIILGMPITLKK